jgi:hypothetical protein
MKTRVVNEIERILNRYQKYDNDLFVQQIDRLYTTYESPQHDMQEIYTGLKEGVNIANEVHCCILGCNTALNHNVVSMLKNATRFLEKYHMDYDAQYGFKRYTDPLLRRYGETSYHEIITRHFTPPRRIQQADEEMIILWHDLRHMMVILTDMRNILSHKRKRPEVSPPPLQV